MASAFLRPYCILPLILAGFVALEYAMPLRTAVKIGADEGFEYAKIVLWRSGYEFYTEIWNDQPLLHTFLITQAAKYISPAVLGPRLVTVAYAFVLLIAVFLVASRLHGTLAASIATLLLIASPSFLELASSCMVEVPVLATTMAALCFIWLPSPGRTWIGCAVGGFVFAQALQIKFIAAIYLPVVAAMLLLNRYLNPEGVIKVGDRPHAGSLGSGGVDRGAGFRFRRVLTSRPLWSQIAVFSVSLAASFTIIHLLVGEGSYFLQLKQSWGAHFATTRSFEYGSPAEHRFEWIALLKNWDLTLPAAAGVLACLCRGRGRAFGLLSVGWLILTLAVFATHRPWWPNYYVHNAVPLCLCAAAGLDAVREWCARRRHSPVLVGVALYLVVTLGWMGTRVYLQADAARRSPRIYRSVVLNEIQRYRPYARLMFAEEPIYSFHAGIPLPPRLGVISLKRFWSGDLTNARLVDELQRCQPEIVLLENSAGERPFQEWLHSDYSLVYQDSAHRMYARKSIIELAEPWPASANPAQ